MYVSDAVIKRLPTYLRYLDMLLADGVYRISSNDLGKIMGLTPSQVRQDINTFGGIGRQGYGYPIIDLKKHIEEVIGVDKPQNMIILGAGNIGSAIVGYTGFGDSGFNTLALFDNDVAKIGTFVNNIPVKSLDDLESFVSNNDVRIAIIACPAKFAQSLCDRALSAGIKAFWNFAPVDLKLNGNAVSVNVSLSESLQQLSFRLKQLI
ncbi:MAG: redox-sensing transcriptional repressor Rex [Eubacteriales bacterium]|nr:redox-sensing transcriptional repressor Rex [Eubacteriales bacterium]